MCVCVKVFLLYSSNDVSLRVNILCILFFISFSLFFASFQFSFVHYVICTICQKRAFCGRILNSAHSLLTILIADFPKCNLFLATNWQPTPTHSINFPLLFCFHCSSPHLHNNITFSVGFR